MRNSILILATICFFSRVVAQTGGRDTAQAKYTIQNCVNEFTIGKIESTKVGYQYWFADKDFMVFINSSLERFHLG